MSSTGSVDLPSELTRIRLSLELLVQRRMVLLLAADALLVFGALIGAHLGGGEPGQIYFVAINAVFLLLGIPVLSGTVAVERRAGSLDLVLASPGGQLFFLRRVAAICGLMLLQGWATLALALLTPSRSFPLLPVLVHSALLAVLIGGVVLFWSLRLRGAGPVAFASFLTVLVLGKWTYFNPVRGPQADPMSFLVESTKAGLVLALAATVFYLYALRRLRRPEAFIG